MPFLLVGPPSIIRVEQSATNEGERERGERGERSLLLHRSIEFGSSETDSAAKLWPGSGEGGVRKGRDDAPGREIFGGEGGGHPWWGVGVWVGVAGSIQGGFVASKRAQPHCYSCFLLSLSLSFPSFLGNYVSTLHLVRFSYSKDLYNEC